LQQPKIAPFVPNSQSFTKEVDLETIQRNKSLPLSKRYAATPRKTINSHIEKGHQASKAHRIRSFGITKMNNNQLGAHKRFHNTSMQGEEAENSQSVE